MVQVKEFCRTYLKKCLSLLSSHDPAEVRPVADADLIALLDRRNGSDIVHIIGLASCRGYVRTTSVIDSCYVQAHVSRVEVA